MRLSSPPGSSTASWPSAPTGPRSSPRSTRPDDPEGRDGGEAQRSVPPRRVEVTVPTSPCVLVVLSVGFRSCRPQVAGLSVRRRNLWVSVAVSATQDTSCGRRHRYVPPDGGTPPPHPCRPCP